MSTSESLYNRLVAEGDDPDAPRRVDVEHRGDRAIVTLDEPDRLNVLSAPLVRQLRGALEALVVDREIRSVVLTGRDPGFSAGGDLKMMETATGKPEPARGRRRRVALDSPRVRRDCPAHRRIGHDLRRRHQRSRSRSRAGLGAGLRRRRRQRSRRDRAGVRSPRPDSRGRHQLGADPATGIPRGACLLPARRAHRCPRSATARPGSTGRRPRHACSTPPMSGAHVSRRCRRMPSR